MSANTSAHNENQDAPVVGGTQSAALAPTFASPVEGDEAVSRRRLLRRLGAAGAGLGVALMGGARAAADPGQPGWGHVNGGGDGGDNLPVLLGDENASGSNDATVVRTAASNNYALGGWNLAVTNGQLGQPRPRRGRRLR